MRLIIVEVAYHTKPYLLQRCVAGGDAQSDGVVGSLLKAAQEQAIVTLLDTNPRAGHVDIAQSGNVTFLHAPDIQFDSGNTLRTDGTLGQCITSPHQLFGRHGLQTQSAVCQTPFRIIRVVVPLPYPAKRLAIEILVALVGSMGNRLLLWHSNRLDGGFEPRTGCTTEVALQSEHRPSVLPCDGSKGHCASDAMEVHHQQSPPLSTLILYDTSLMDIRTSRSIHIDLWNTKLRPILSDTILLTLGHLCQ